MFYRLLLFLGRARQVRPQTIPPKLSTSSIIHVMSLELSLVSGDSVSVFEDPPLESCVGAAVGAAVGSGVSVDSGVAVGSGDSEGSGGAEGSGVSVGSGVSGAPGLPWVPQSRWVPGLPWAALPESPCPSPPPEPTRTRSPSGHRRPSRSR